MEIIFIGILFMIGVYVAPFVIGAVFVCVSFLGAGIVAIIERFKR